jgi:hypothetical protein
VVGFYIIGLLIILEEDVYPVFKCISAAYFYLLCFFRPHFVLSVVVCVAGELQSCFDAIKG